MVCVLLIGCEKVANRLFRGREPVHIYVWCVCCVQVWVVGRVSCIVPSPFPFSPPPPTTLPHSPRSLHAPSTLPPTPTSILTYKIVFAGLKFSRRLEFGQIKLKEMRFLTTSNLEINGWVGIEQNEYVFLEERS